MERRLDFSGPKAQVRFDLCLQALFNAGGSLLHGGAMAAKGRNREVRNKEGRLFDALESISDPAPTDENKDARVLIGEDLVLRLAQEDHALLLKYVAEMPWLPRFSRESNDCEDWIEAAERAE